MCKTKVKTCIQVVVLSRTPLLLLPNTYIPWVFAGSSQTPSPPVQSPMPSCKHSTIKFPKTGEIRVCFECNTELNVLWVQACLPVSVHKYISKCECKSKFTKHCSQVHSISSKMQEKKKKTFQHDIKVVSPNSKVKVLAIHGEKINSPRTKTVFTHLISKHRILTLSSGHDAHTCDDTLVTHEQKN